MMMEEENKKVRREYNETVRGLVEFVQKRDKRVIDMQEEGGEIEEDNEVEEEKNKELYCVACGKKFKSEKQLKNNEQSKMHKEKVVELREAFVDEENVNSEREKEEDGKEEGPRLISSKESWGTDNDEMDSMVHNNMKSARRKRRGRRYDEEATTVDATETTGQVGKDNGLDSGFHDDETYSRLMLLW
ncbi:DNAJ heat shock N-terminal domain-containing protein [Actinidia rufa]|uniref:DNAJ heat shock N-terminal domain-containing protein n=1 Tax=Actinidia rufa TaxID=165716 RepID=A0A7J0ELB9_9ERIC|nr:DNAJ heat shock N-terminal domain-containing protein [Actinidia rufa]